MDGVDAVTRGTSGESPRGWATAQQAAGYIGYAEQTLANWRSRRRGPRYSKVNGSQVRYRYADLDAWLEAGGDA